jgi:SOS-response transcriptional repressor LexA
MLVSSGCNARMQTIKERRRSRVLKLINEKFSGNKAAFAKAIGRPAPNVHRMLAEPSVSGKEARGIGEELARDIEKKLGIKPYWLDEFGNLIPVSAHENTEEFSDALNSVRSLYSKDGKPPDPRHYGTIPVISWVQAGLFCSSPDLFHPGDADDFVPAIRRFGDRTYALRVKGDSMISNNPGEKSYPEGCIIYVDPDKEVTNGCRVVARIHANEEATFKKYSEDAGKRYLRPLNKDYEPIIMTEEMHICGVVVGSWMDE